MVDVLRLVFITIKDHDEEAQTVHIPIFMTNLLLALGVSVMSPCFLTFQKLMKVQDMLRRAPSKASESWLLDILALLPRIFQLTPSAALLDWQQIANESELSPLPPLRAKQIYELEANLFTETQPSDDNATPFRVAWHSLIDSSVQCVTIASSADDPSPSLHLLTSIISTLNSLLSRMKAKITSLDWDQSLWMKSMLSSLRLDPPFELVDELIVFMVSLIALKTLKTPFTLGGRDVKREIIKSVGRYYL